MDSPMRLALEKVLADSYALYLKAQNYHWNIRAVNFVDVHRFFEEIYTHLASSIDVIAELIRAVDLEYKIPATFDYLKSHASLQDAQHTLSASEMVRDLFEDQEKICQTIAAAIKVADQVGEYGVSDFLTSQFGAHKKFRWILHSMLV